MQIKGTNISGCVALRWSMPRKRQNTRRGKSYYKIHCCRGETRRITSPNMNDIEFALRVSAQVGELYRKAKRDRYRTPQHTLVQTRGLASLCCDLLWQGEPSAWPTNLEEKIASLVRGRRINPDTRELLSGLRRSGNLGAHPEMSLRGEQEFCDMAKQGLQDARSLLEIVFREVHGGASVPDYVVVDEQPAELSELCHGALIVGRPSDQYEVAWLLQLEAEARWAKAKEDPDPAAYGYAVQVELDSMRRRAVDLLGYASEAGFAPAQYKFAMALLNGVRGKGQEPIAVAAIAAAARQGYADALVWCGQAYLYGQHGFEINFDAARDYLEQAADEDHPAALTLLSRMYRNGRGVPKDASAAFRLTLQAAEAGFPAAQFEAAVALREGNGIQVDKNKALSLLRQASDAGYPEAQRMMANLIRYGELPSSAGDVEALLGKAMRESSYAWLDMAGVLVEKGDTAHLIQGAYLLQECYEKALLSREEELARACRSLAPLIVAKLEASIPGLSDKEFSELLMLRFMFDQSGMPYPNRMERTRLFLDIARQIKEVKGKDRREEDRLALIASSGMRLKSVQQPRPQLEFVEPVTPRLAGRKVGRNELCPCGSERKFKNCCA